MTEQFNWEKMEAVMHYIIHNARPLSYSIFDKLLYFNDFNFYELYEKSMTNEHYVKLAYGVMPMHRDRILSLLHHKNLVGECEVFLNTDMAFSLISVKEPDLSSLSAIEVKHIDETIDRYGHMSEAQFEAVLHKDIPYMSSDGKNSIDYELVFYRSEEMSVRIYPKDKNDSDKRRT